jgi:hypothetical protein
LRNTSLPNDHHGRPVFLYLQAKLLSPNLSEIWFTDALGLSAAKGGAHVGLNPGFDFSANVVVPNFLA